jgi:hypothetical protein
VERKTERIEEVVNKENKMLVEIGRCILSTGGKKDERGKKDGTYGD